MAIVDSELEGPVSNRKLAAGGMTMNVVGVSVFVADGVAITSPTNSKLTTVDLLNNVSFPGRAEAGYDAATAIVAGKYDTDTKLLTADSIEIEPAENLLSGAFSKANPLTINDVTVTKLSDSRMPCLKITNEFGFEVIPTDALVGTLAIAGGYFANNEFFAHTIELSGLADLKSNAPQLAITRAKAREREPNNKRGDELEIRGSVTLLHTGATQQLIEIFRVDAGVETKLGTTVATMDADFNKFATFRYNDDTPPTVDPVLGKAPTTIRAYNRSDDAGNCKADLDTDLRPL
jgi:hypothetical protein